MAGNHFKRAVMLDQLKYDLKLAFRSVYRYPVVALVAASSLALGIGANASIFSIVNAVLFSYPPGIHEPERLVEVGRTQQASGFDTFSYPDYLDLREEAGTFEHLTAWGFQSASYSASEGGERWMGLTTSANYFNALGVLPHLGRFFIPEEDDTPGAHPVVVLDHHIWTEKFGSDPEIIGTSIRLSRVTFEVVGITPPEFRGHVIGIRPDFYIPITMLTSITRESVDRFTRRGHSWTLVLGKLAPGVSLDQANAVTRGVMDRLAIDFAETNEFRNAVVVPLGPVPAAGRTAVAAFLGAISALVALILLITCANVAGILLASAASREKEVAVRLALGSPRARVVRQLVIESLIIFSAAGAFGLMIALWSTSTLSSLQLPIPIELVLDLTPDFRVLAYGFGATIIVGLLFGLLPAMQVSKPHLTSIIKESGIRSPHRAKLRRVFVMGQVGVSLVLLVAAGLFLRALDRASSVPIGFDPAAVSMTSVNLSLEGYDEDAGRPFHDRLVQSLEALPGVQAAALSLDLPLDVGANSTGLYPESLDDQANRVSADFNVVSDDYFDVLRIPVLRGQTFRPTHDVTSEPVMVVSALLAETVWPGEDPIGKRARFGGRDRPFRTVIGVVGNTFNQTLTETPRSMVYLPLRQSYQANVLITVRSQNSASLANQIRTGILALDPELTVTPVLPLEEYTAVAILPQKFTAFITAALSILAIILCAIGIYGLVAHLVALQTREIGIRMALGANQGRVLRQFLGHAFRLALPGLVMGTGAALAVGYALRAFLIGLSPTDPTALIGGGMTLTLVVILTSLVPAHRASRTDPMTALRTE